IRNDGLREFFLDWARVTGGRDYLVWREGELLSGVRFWGRDWECERIAPRRIESVEWNAGQASSLAGRGLRAWELVLWLDLEKRIEGKYKPGQEVRVFGPDQPKEKAGELGRSFLEFLRVGGVFLVQGKKESSFVRDESLSSERHSG